MKLIETGINGTIFHLLDVAHAIRRLVGPESQYQYWTIGTTQDSAECSSRYGTSPHFAMWQMGGASAEAVRSHYVKLGMITDQRYGVPLSATAAVYVYRVAQPSDASPARPREDDQAPIPLDFHRLREALDEALECFRIGTGDLDAATLRELRAVQSQLLSVRTRCVNLGRRLIQDATEK